MAVRWAGVAFVLLVVGSLCCASVSHGCREDLSSLPGSKVRREFEFQRGGVELNSGFDGLVVGTHTGLRRGDVTISSPSIGEILIRIADSDKDRPSENHYVPIIQGQKWKTTLRNIGEWIFHACIVVLVVYVIFYAISCFCACCIGLDILVEIWRILGGWRAFSYFVHVEQSVAETDPEPLPLLRSAAEP